MVISSKKLSVGFFIVAMTAASIAAVAQDAEKTSDWQKSRWGENDTIGAVNYLSPEIVKQAADLIKTGKTYSLGVELNRDFPAYGTRFFDITVIEPRAGGQPIGPNDLTSTDRPRQHRRFDDG